jgi:hypothetical protein
MRTDFDIFAPFTATNSLHHDSPTTLIRWHPFMPLHVSPFEDIPLNSAGQCFILLRLKKAFKRLSAAEVVVRVTFRSNSSNEGKNTHQESPGSPGGSYPQHRVLKGPIMSCQPKNGPNCCICGAGNSPIPVTNSCFCRPLGKVPIDEFAYFLSFLWRFFYAIVTNRDHHDSSGAFPCHYGYCLA